MTRCAAAHLVNVLDVLSALILLMAHSLCPRNSAAANAQQADCLFGMPARERAISIMITDLVDVCGLCSTLVLFQQYGALEDLWPGAC